MDPVIFCASFTNIIIFLISYYFLIMSFLRLEAWGLALAALAAGRLFLFNFRLCRARSAASPVFQVIVIFFVAYIFYNLNQGRRRNIWASILNQKTSHSCARTPGLGPGGRVQSNLINYCVYFLFFSRGSISFLTMRKISSIASAILFSCSVSILFLSICILYYPITIVKLGAWSLELQQ